jgi:hypothetical protein
MTRHRYGYRGHGRRRHGGFWHRIALAIAHALVRKLLG